MDVSTPDWVKDAVFYQIFPDRFAKSERLTKPTNLQTWGDKPTFHAFQGGDLLGVAEKLDYLADLGITAIYFNPIFASTANHRYHTHDFFAVDPLLGGQPAFAEMLAAAHQRGIRVILDGVFNHASRGFYQFNHLLESGRESPYVDWFHVYQWPVNAYAEHQRPNYAAWWNLHALPKLNTDNPTVREFLWSVGTHWLEQGIDGWRLDVPGEIDDDHFWREFRRRCRAINPEAYIVGEFWDEAHRWLKGDQFDAQMNYLFTRLAFGFCGGHNLNQSDSVHTGLKYMPALNGHQFARALENLHQLYHPQIVQAQLNILSSHDMPRLMTIANHDLSTVNLMFLLQMTVAGAPNIYYGDEIGLAGGRDPDCRRAFPWHDEGSWNQELRDKVRRYIALRKASPALRRGDFRVLHESGQLVVFSRQYGQAVAVVALNVGFKDESFVPAGPNPGPLVDGLDQTGDPMLSGQEIRVGARSGRVWLNS